MTTDTVKKPVLTKVPRGHWRNLWAFIPGKKNWKGSRIPPDEAWINDHLFMGSKKWPCKDSAETRAAEIIARSTPEQNRRSKYFGAKFFPGA